jgi:manganese efflux pump family protein
LWHTKAVTGSQLLSVLIIALGLSMDCFAVALSGSIGMKSFKPVQVVRVALSFGLFQTAMPVLGWLAGQTVVGLIGAYDHWVAFSAAGGSRWSHGLGVFP